VQKRGFVRLVVLALWTLLATAVMGCGDNDHVPGEDCSVPGDEDGNGAADCGDPVCSTEPACSAACGNGKVEAGEGCDDGNPASGDGCDANCTPTGCGNGVVTAGEGCDDGNPASGDGCDANCTQTGCGNGVQTAGEACDDGNTTNGDGCNANCTIPECGDGIVTGAEVCDDGNLTSGDGCDANCTPTACGNGIVTTGEVCDDGNATSGDGCDANCTATGCGNGIPTTGEQCDDGNTTNGDSCDSNCTFPECGNGVVSGAEVCDDGNLTSGDGCDANCTPTACGNGVVTAGEQCDDGNPTSDDGCDANCTLTGCGNGVVTAGEQCDDGNTNPGDGCTNLCTICGDGQVAPGETCDDGNLTSDDGCDANCTPSGCGNGFVSPSEQCDDANVVDTDGCTNACTICGNGQVAAREICDDGNLASGDGCDANCRPTGCGNFVVTDGEACDDGNTTALDGCGESCQLEPLEQEPNEDGTTSTGGAGVNGNDFGSANPDANGAFTSTVTIRAAISPVGDEDVFKFGNTSATTQAIKLEVWNRALGKGVPCGQLIDTALHIRDAAGTSLLLNDDRNGPADRCSSLVYGVLPGQSVYAHVIEYGDNGPIPGYALEATFSPVTCGDGVIGPGENCEDGNATGGDGCSALCQVETTDELEPNNTTAEATASTVQITGSVVIKGALTPVADLDTFRVTVATPQVLRFEAFTSLFDCNASTIDLRVFDATGAELITDVDGQGVLQCGAISVFLDVGTYFIRVEERGTNAPIPSYYLQVTYQADRGVELEPASTSGINDTIMTASANLASTNHAFVYGDHQSPDDTDVYAIDVPAGTRIRAELIEGDRATESCESNTIDSRLTLFDQNGTQLVEDDDDGRGFCSLIDGSGAMPLDPAARNASTVKQRFYLMVRRSALASGNQQLFVYRLAVSFR